MKFVCLGYIEENKWETMSASGRNAMMDECFAYDDVLRKNGHFAGGEALQSARNAATLRWKHGQLAITDGPYAETKEQLGGILILEARDLNHAIRLMSKHPGVKAGPFEIRPAEDLSAMVAESERRRSKSKENRIPPEAGPTPEAMHTVTPHLVCAGAAEAIEFYKRAFDAVELMRLPGPDGKLMHAMIRIGDSAVMLVDESPDWGMRGPKSLKGSPVTIHLNVADADEVSARAAAAGATVIMPVQEMFWGDRYGVLEDPFGHHWSVATRVRDVSPEELQRAARKAAAEGCANPHP